jgi:hypothetical protein
MTSGEVRGIFKHGELYRTGQETVVILLQNFDYPIFHGSCWWSCTNLNFALTSELIHFYFGCAKAG